MLFRISSNNRIIKRTVSQNPPLFVNTFHHSKRHPQKKYHDDWTKSSISYLLVEIITFLDDHWLGLDWMRSLAYKSIQFITIGTKPKADFHRWMRLAPNGWNYRVKPPNNDTYWFQDFVSLLGVSVFGGRVTPLVQSAGKWCLYHKMRCI